ncbi:hypothetical protein MNBD_ALPHA03-1901 [hydrothermal vent metagenome]|uniref:Flagellar protein FlaG n=1 Tax=hydrothermal vent metagenome TaxID=652676 RepID=A0A3B1BFM2_9ZZZZ
MVETNNITSPRLAAAGERSVAVPKASVVTDSDAGIQPSSDAGQESRAAPTSVLSVISQSAEKRLDSLISGSAGDFLKAAEKIIDASLPNKPPGTKLRIDLDDSSGKFIYQGVDINTGEVVTQFPSEDILKLIAYNKGRDGVEGIVVDEEA